MRKTTGLFIFLLLAGTANAKGGDDDEAASKKMYSVLTFLILSFFFWHFLIEISLVIVKNYKQSSTYIANHSFINFCTIVGFNIYLVFFIRRYASLRDPFIAVHLGMILFEVVQIMMGILLDRKLRNLRLNRGIFIFKMLHRFNGIFIYVAEKALLYHYLYYFLHFRGHGHFICLAVPLALFTSMLFLHFSFYVARRQGKYNDDAPLSYLEAAAGKTEVYRAILQNVYSLEAEADSDPIDLTGAPKADHSEANAPLISNMRDVHWVAIEDKLFDISGFRHPKGQFVLEQVRGKDITREFYGLKNYYFDNKNPRYSKVMRHRHTGSTLSKLQRHCIGEFKLVDMLQNRNGSSLDREETMSLRSQQTINLIKNDKNDVRKENQLAFLGWSVRQSLPFDRNQNVLFFKKSDDSVALNLSSYWVDNFGKYFLGKLANSERVALFPVLSLSHVYISQKLSWFSRNALSAMNLTTPADNLVIDPKFFDEKLTS